MQQSTAQHSTAQLRHRQECRVGIYAPFGLARNTAQHSTAQHSTAQHSTAQLQASLGTIVSSTYKTPIHCCTSLFVFPLHITSHHITSHHITSRHITSHHITSHHITSHHITSHHITSHLITSQHRTAQRSHSQQSAAQQCKQPCHQIQVEWQSAPCWSRFPPPSASGLGWSRAPLSGRALGCRTTGAGTLMC